MGEIHFIRVVQVRILKPDELPFHLMSLQGISNAIKNKFNFKQLIPNEVQLMQGIQITSVSYNVGECLIDDELILIDSLRIEPRKITIAATADSSKVTRIYDSLIATIMEISGQYKTPDLSPLLLTEETTTVVKLSKPITNFFEQSKIENFALAVRPQIQNYSANISIQPVSIKYKISYDDLPENLAINKIGLLEKEVVIEVRSQSQINDNLYFIQSPNSSEEHFKILDLFEAMICR